MMNDELQIYRGKDFVINEKISIHQPTLEPLECGFGRHVWKLHGVFSLIAGTPLELYKLQRRHEIRLSVNV